MVDIKSNKDVTRKNTEVLPGKRTYVVSITEHN